MSHRHALANPNLEENMMIELSPRDRELVALGAAMGSNCIACIEYHIPEARRVGLSDTQIEAAIRHADKLRQVPARKTLRAAQEFLPSLAGAARDAGDAQDCGCAERAQEQAAATPTVQPGEVMSGMMAKMIDALGCQGQAGAAATRVGPGASAGAAGCGCR